MDIGVLGVLAELTNLKVLAFEDANSDNIAPFHSYNSSMFMACAIDYGPELIIITLSSPSLSSFLKQFAFDLLFLESSKSCPAGPRLFSRLLSLVFLLLLLMSSLAQLL